MGLATVWTSSTRMAAVWTRQVLVWKRGLKKVSGVASDTRLWYQPSISHQRIPCFQGDSVHLPSRSRHKFAQYADRPVLQFQCQVTLCLKLDGGCIGISPPRCPETKPRHLAELQSIRRRAKSKFTRKSRRSNPETGEQTLDVFTRPMMVSTHYSINKSTFYFLCRL